MSYAFWQYDLFPYLKGGRVTQFGRSAGGTDLVMVEGYGNHTFVPDFTIKDDKIGADLLLQVEGLEARRNYEERQLRERFNKELEETLLKYGFANTKPPEYIPEFTALPGAALP